MMRTTIAAGFVFALFAAALPGLSQAQSLASALPIFDDFSDASGQITAANYENTTQELVREIRSGQLVIIQRTSDVSLFNSLFFFNSNSVFSIAADVTVLAHSSSGGSTRARLSGGFYNDGSLGATPGSAVGDIFSEIRVIGTDVSYLVFRCTTFNCSTGDVLGSASIGTALLGTTHKLSMAWDGSVFTFRLDADPPQTFDPVLAGAPVVSATPFRLAKSIGGRVTVSAGQSGFLSATFDNVEVNGSLYDDFSAVSGRIDGTLWNNQSLDFAREVQSAELAIKQRARFINASNQLNIANPATIVAMAVDVTVIEFESTGGSPRARLAGVFYNDGTPGSAPGSNLGDIFAEISVRGSEASFLVFRCGNPCPAGGPLTVPIFIPLGPVSLGTTHSLFMQWDGALFTFQLDSNPSVSFDPVAAGAPVVSTLPNAPFKRLGARMTVGSADAFLSAKFDNLRTGTAAIATNTGTGTNVVVQPVDPTTGSSPVTLTFDVVTTGGSTSLITSDTGPPPPEGFQLGSPPTFYEISTSASFVVNVEVCIDYSGVSYFVESTLALFHFESGSWVDVTTSLDTVNDVICGSVSSFSTFAVFQADVVEVEIDIKPGSSSNKINLRSQGKVPVAILGSATFDATTVDPATVTLAGAPVSVNKKGSPQASVEDINGDGRMDLVVHVITQALELTPSDTEAVLEGQTFENAAIRGSDTVQIKQ